MAAKKKAYRLKDAFDRSREYSDFTDREGAAKRGPTFLDSPLGKTPRDVSPAMHNWHGGRHWNDPTNRPSGPKTKDKMPGVDNNKSKAYKLRGLI
jgi:metallophosphoesterase superfamily enzyme